LFEIHFYGNQQCDIPGIFLFETYGMLYHFNWKKSAEKKMDGLAIC